MKNLTPLAIPAGLLLAYSLGFATEKPAQQAYMIWKSGCLTITVGENTYVQAPMVNGEADMTRATLHRANATVNKSCGIIEIRREP